MAASASPSPLLRCPDEILVEILSLASLQMENATHEERRTNYYHNGVPPTGTPFWYGHKDDIRNAAWSRNGFWDPISAASHDIKKCFGTLGRVNKKFHELLPEAVFKYRMSNMRLYIWPDRPLDWFDGITYSAMSKAQGIRRGGPIAFRREENKDLAMPGYTFLPHLAAPLRPILSSDPVREIALTLPDYLFERPEFEEFGSKLYIEMFIRKEQDMRQRLNVYLRAVEEIIAPCEVLTKIFFVIDARGVVINGQGEDEYEDDLLVDFGARVRAVVEQHAQAQDKKIECKILFDMAMVKPRQKYIHELPFEEE